MNQYLCEHYPLGDGTMTCRWVSQRDARRAIRLYGGTVALAPETCLVEPLLRRRVSPLASGGTAVSTPVSLSWQVPAGMPGGSMFLVTVHPPGMCGSDQIGGLIDTYRIPPTGQLDRPGAGSLAGARPATSCGPQRLGRVAAGVRDDAMTGPGACAPAPR